MTIPYPDTSTATTSTLAPPETQPAASSAPADIVRPQVSDNPTTDDQQRWKAQEAAWKAYDGKLPDPLKAQKDGLNDNAKSNRLKPIVQKGASFLFPEGLTFSVQAEQKDTTAADAGDVETGDDEAQTFLDTFWQRNRQSALLHKLAINGGVYGHPFILLIPAKDRKATPRMQLINPTQVRVETVPGDCEMVLSYVISDKRYDAATASTRETRKIIERIDPDGSSLRGEFDDDSTWRITDQQRIGGDSSQWHTTTQTDWAYPFPPLFECQNLPVPNDFWGEADVTHDLIEQAQGINFNQSNVSRTLKWHANPLTWGTGFRGGQIDRSPDNIVSLAEGATLQNLEMQSDLHSSLNFLETLRANMDEQSRVPAVALGRQESLPKGNLSGVALALLFQPLVEKTNQKRSLYGPMLEEMCSAVLVLAGFASRIEDIPVSIQWPPILPNDPQVEWQTAQLKQAIGVSKTTLLEEGGYDPDEQAELKAQEDQAQLTAFAQGQGLPPTEPLPDGNEPQQQQPGQPGTQPSNAPDPNHPAAVAARMKMQAAFGKPVTSDGRSN